ncbi:MAG TPA: zinc-dependent alcohol dehydrogenase [Alphaproteobacteria bacterium]
MKALCWHGKGDVRVDTVPDPGIEDPGDVIVKVSSTAICGSDLHLYDGYIPGMAEGDILGHEFMGEVVEVGADVQRLRKGDRVVVPFPIACGECFFCQRELYSCCDATNPNAEMAAKVYGYATAGIFGYSHLTGGYAGGQAEYVRVPHADVGPLKVPEGMADEQVLFLSDILPTGWMAALNCDIQPGDTVAVWGCGPVGQFAIASARLLGAERIVAIDRVPERLALARSWAGATDAIHFVDEEVYDRLQTMTEGRGPDACIDAVGMEAHGWGEFDAALDRAKAFFYLATDRAAALRQILMCCRKGGNVSVAGVYGGAIDKFPFGAVMQKGLTIRSGQTHVQRYMRPLLERIRQGEIDPAFIVTHRAALDDGPAAYRTFRDKANGCIKVVMTPDATSTARRSEAAAARPGA